MFALFKIKQPILIKTKHRILRFSKLLPYTFLLLVIFFGPAIQTSLASDVLPLKRNFDQQVHPRLTIPESDIAVYSKQLNDSLAQARMNLYLPQYVVVVDRNKFTQAAMIFFGSESLGWQLIGATPVSTGLPGQFEHFETPLGVFDHSLNEPDFRAEGTKNSQGFRGYGVKGMRIYDFGWVDAPKTWGNRALSVMRLQMHATDPDLAEPYLGTRRSKGCIRIPASLNDFLDRYGILDEDYESALAQGQRLWVLRKDRTPAAHPGRYMVIVDSERDRRPIWSPAPAQK